MLVRDVMTPDPVTTRAGTTIKEALQLLTHHGVTSLPVVDATGRIVGVVSEADLIRDSLLPDPRVARTPTDVTVARPHQVDEVMSNHPVTVRTDTDLSSAVELMTSTSVKSLPVVDNRDRLVGIVSRSDVVHILARADTLIEREVDALLVSLGHLDWLVEVADGVVAVSGPRGASERALAHLAAHTVPGVVDVRIT